MMKSFMPLCIFGLATGLFFIVFGESPGDIYPAICSYSEGNITVDKVCELVSSDGTWTLSPAKYIYWGEDGQVRVSATISNLSGEESIFTMGDGNTTMVPPNGNLTYSYTASLDGSTTRYFIVKEGQGFVREALTLKIEPF